ncbi:hypothetical protein Clim_0288 [Chlorobium limicola DSM 245]|uniref:Uncharacterized protein n=1 Tax=Chlorobium limicola (strain DSM 245 / NBRC 103803 / 6330) TaxID=290315 RepID=B3EF99_CHLL2|nr:hypothetical protein Clim_0288 [Chlorobium limicola DSM 245]
MPEYSPKLKRHRNLSVPNSAIIFNTNAEPMHFLSDHRRKFFLLSQEKPKETVIQCIRIRDSNETYGYGCSKAFGNSPQIS